MTQKKGVLGILADCKNLPPVVLGKNYRVTYNSENNTVIINGMVVVLKERFFSSAVTLIDEDDGQVIVMIKNMFFVFCSKECKPATVAALLALSEHDAYMNKMSEDLRTLDDPNLSLKDRLQIIDGWYDVVSLVRGRAELYGLLPMTDLSYSKNFERLSAYTNDKFDRLIVFTEPLSYDEDRGDSSRATLTARVVALWPKSAEHPPEGYAWFTK
jgi:hypothetical protein